MAAPPTPAPSSSGGFISKFTVLKSAPRELWLIYYAKIMEIAAYGLVSMGLMLYMINDVGFKDVTAGSFISIWSISISFFTLLAGSLTDAIGIRKTLLYGSVLCLASRVIIAFTAIPWIVLPLSLAPMSIGLALMVPVMTAAMRRYTNKNQRSIGFSLYYVLMNVGFIISGKLFDVIRTAMGKDGVLSLLGMEFSVYRTIFLISVAFTFLGLLPVLFFMRKGVQMDEEGDTYTVDPTREQGQQGMTMTASFMQVLKKTVNILIEVGKEAAFYRFLLLVTLLIGVKMVFYHMHYTLPPYSDRELGFGSRFGTAWGVLNPAIIVLLVPIIGALAQKVSSYKMIVIGTLFSALPTFLLVLPNDFFAGLVGTPVGTIIKGFLDIDGELSPLYITLILFVLIFSVGEAIWSPRLYEYTASVAPKGREGTYMGLSILPLFLAKIGVGPLSGLLLNAYCPTDGARQSEMIWWFVAGIAVLSPLGILALRKVVSPKKAKEVEG